MIMALVKRWCFNNIDYDADWSDVIEGIPDKCIYSSKHEKRCKTAKIAKDGYCSRHRKEMWRLSSLKHLQCRLLRHEIAQEAGQELLNQMIAGAKVDINFCSDVIDTWLRFKDYGPHNTSCCGKAQYNDAEDYE